MPGKWFKRILWNKSSPRQERSIASKTSVTFLKETGLRLKPRARWTQTRRLHTRYFWGGLPVSHIAPPLKLLLGLQTPERDSQTWSLARRCLSNFNFFFLIYKCLRKAIHPPIIPMYLKLPLMPTAPALQQTKLYLISPSISIILSFANLLGLLHTTLLPRHLLFLFTPNGSWQPLTESVFVMSSLLLFPSVSRATHFFQTLLMTLCLLHILLFKKNL